MKKKLIYSISLFLIMLIFAASATYAYFTTVFVTDDLSKVEITSAMMPVLLIENSSDLNLYITAAEMSEDNYDVDSPVKSVSSQIKITAMLSEYGGTSEIYYDVYYVPTETYYRSSENIIKSDGSYEREFNISFSSKLSGESGSYELSDVGQEELVYSGSFTVNGIDSIQTEYIDVLLSFYNQDFDQSDNAGKNFGGSLSLEIAEVYYTVE